ncbi:MAG: tetratricopeptide repeat protein [Desulfobacteraceae bacterium]
MRGFGEAASGRWEEAIPLIERFVKYNPKAGFAYLILAVLYAQVGRTQEARAMLDKGTKGWPAAMKNVRFIMSLLSFGDLQTAERFAEGFVEAGLPGEPSGFYKISKENRLTEKEIRELFFGRKVSGSPFPTGKQWRCERTKDGKATIHDGDHYDAGKSWIEEDMLCDRWDNLYEGLKDCWVVYRNPEGTPEKNDEYLGAPGYGIYPFSPVE